MENTLSLDEKRQAVLRAILPEVLFDGWGDEAFAIGAQAAGLSDAQAKIAFPRGALDAAIYLHKLGDQEMAEILAGELDSIQGISAKIERAVNLRLEIAGRHKDAVRQATALFALPQNATEGAGLVWHTADAIWRAIGDDAKGFGYYSKRSTLSAVYSASLLYWLQDDSADGIATREFVTRRIKDVGNFGRFTSKFKRKTA